MVAQNFGTEPFSIDSEDIREDCDAEQRSKKWIARKNLTEEKKQDIKYVAATERDMKAFLQDLPSVGALPADFALGSSSVTSSF